MGERSEDSGHGPSVAITGMAVVSAAGRGTAPLMDAVIEGRPAFRPISRFDTARFRTHVAATLPGSPDLVTELTDVVSEALDGAGLSNAERAACPLVLASRVDSRLTRLPADARTRWSTGALASDLALRSGLGPALRAYTGACVAASTAVADTASLIAGGQLDRAVVAAGFLLDADNFALFDAGRALADDGQVRPFSDGRRGLLLGDGVAAVVLESTEHASRRSAAVRGWIKGWGRAGDAYHVCKPRPDGDGLARAITSALGRAHLAPHRIGYINANGTGTQASDVSETSALRTALGASADRIPVSSTKSVHGHALEASGLLELIVTALALETGKLPVNAGFRGPDDGCDLDLILDSPRTLTTPYALSLNAAFGGANTALVVRAAA